MNKSIHRGSLEMVAAMLISGTIGWLVMLCGQSVLDVVFWRCLFGAATLLVICAFMGFLRPGILTHGPQAPANSPASWPLPVWRWRACSSLSASRRICSAAAW